MVEAGKPLRRGIGGMILCVVLMGGWAWSPVPLLAQQGSLPKVQATALDGHAVSLPRDLSTTTIIIVGFSRGSADATTAWEIPVRNKLASSTVGIYDVAVLASVPGFLHGWVTRSIRGKVPAVLQPRFLPVFKEEAGWKLACGYDAKAPDAPYVLLVDRSGKVLWRTHEAYSPAEFERLSSHLHGTANPGTP